MPGPASRLHLRLACRRAGGHGIRRLSDLRIHERRARIDSAERCVDRGSGIRSRRHHCGHRTPRTEAGAGAGRRSDRRQRSGKSGGSHGGTHSAAQGRMRGGCRQCRRLPRQRRRWRERQRRPRQLRGHLQRHPRCQLPAAGSHEPLPLRHLHGDAPDLDGQRPEFRPGQHLGPHGRSQPRASPSTGLYYSDTNPSQGCDGNLAGGTGNSGATVAQKWWDSLPHRASLYRPTFSGSTSNICINFAMSHGGTGRTGPTSPGLRLAGQAADTDSDTCRGLLDSL